MMARQFTGVEWVDIIIQPVSVVRVFRRACLFSLRRLRFDGFGIFEFKLAVQKFANKLWLVGSGHRQAIANPLVIILVIELVAVAFG